MHLAKLKVRPRKLKQAAPCVAEMITMLNCWSMHATDHAKCAEVAQSLTRCMKSLPTPTKHVNAVNYHLSRLGKLL
jgi:hypothetical protein